jgi:hypothetical protein
VVIDAIARSWDIGGLIGVGCTAKGWGLLWILDARYYFGFRSICNTTYQSDIRNAGFSFLLGLSVPFGS